MPTASIQGNVVSLVMTPKRGSLRIDMSLQRHHYRYCGSGAALRLNSLLYANVTDINVITDATEVGTCIEQLLNSDHRAQVLFGKELRCTSGRIYLVDNSALNPKGFPNHFFPVKGSLLWAKMTQNKYVAASAIRRVELEINKKLVGERGNYVDGKSFYLIRNRQGLANPVIAAYAAAHTALGPVPNADDNLARVSGRKDIVSLARGYH